MKKSERTRQYIIETTAPLFNMLGYEGTSMSALQEATGLTKGSIYGNFADKEEISREVFRYSMKIVKSRIAERLAKKSSAKEKLTALILFFAQFVFDPPIPGGCPLLNNAIDSDDNNIPMKTLVAAEVESVIAFFASLFEEGKREGIFSKEIRSEELAYFFFTSIEGAVMVSRVTSSEKAMKIVVKNLKRIIEQISI